MPSSSRPLRLRCSDIAKLSGLHDFADVPTLLTELLYQGLPELRSTDATEWGIVWVSEEEELKELLNKADAGTRAAFTSATVARPADVSAASTAVQSVTAALATPAATKALSPREANALRQAANHEVNTSFGNRHESSGLECYAKTTSCPVTGTNDQLYKWPFPADPSLATSPNLLATASVAGAAAPNYRLLSPSERFEIECIVRARFIIGESSKQGTDDASTEVLTDEACANSCMDPTTDTSSMDPAAQASGPPPLPPVDSSIPLLATESYDTSKKAQASLDGICWWEPTPELDPPPSSNSSSALPLDAPEFSSSSSSGRLVFSLLLGPKDRKWLHALAEDLGLGHYSEDTSEGRRIVLCSCNNLPAAAEVEVHKEEAAETPPTGSDTLFELVGIVDGLSEELHCAGDDPSQWKHRRNIVVEVRVTEGGTTDWRLLFLKHRMKEVKTEQPCLQCTQSKNSQERGDDVDDQANNAALPYATNEEMKEVAPAALSAVSAAALSTSSLPTVPTASPGTRVRAAATVATPSTCPPSASSSSSTSSVASSIVAPTSAEDCPMSASLTESHTASAPNPEDVKATTASTTREEDEGGEGESSRRRLENSTATTVAQVRAASRPPASTSIVPTEEQRQRAEVNRVAAMRRRRMETNRAAALERLRTRNNNTGPTTTTSASAAGGVAQMPPPLSQPQQPPLPSSFSSSSDQLLTRLREMELSRRRQRPLRPPPLYDVIQLVSYCIMLGTEAGHLVEVKRKARATARSGCKQCAQRNNTEGVDDGTAFNNGISLSVDETIESQNRHTISLAHEEGSSELLHDVECSSLNDEKKEKHDYHQSGRNKQKRRKLTNKAAPELELTIHRICLKAAPQCHGDMYWKVVVPRLYETVSFVHQLRANASRRAAWVLASPLEQWLQLEAACPFIVPSAHQAYINLQREHAFTSTMTTAREEAFLSQSVHHNRGNRDIAATATSLPEVMCNICFSPLVSNCVPENTTGARDDVACGGCGAFAAAGFIIYSCFVCEVHLCETCARASSSSTKQN